MNITITLWPVYFQSDLAAGMGVETGLALGLPDTSGPTALEEAVSGDSYSLAGDPVLHGVALKALGQMKGAKRFPFSTHLSASFPTALPGRCRPAPARMAAGAGMGQKATPGPSDADGVKTKYTKPAKELRNRGKFQQAIALLQKGLEQYPDDLRLLCSMGEVFRRMRDYRTALLWFKKALALDSRDEVAHYSKAKLYYLKGESGKARLHFAPLLERPDPRLPVLYLLAACTTADDPLWVAAKEAVGERKGGQIRKIAEVRDDLLRTLAQEEKMLFSWNPIWDGTGYRPVDRLALQVLGERR